MGGITPDFPEGWVTQSSLNVFCRKEKGGVGPITFPLSALFSYHQ
jgi:hypothetical protein